MTATLIFSTLFGAAASYPLLRRFTRLDRDTVEKLGHRCEWASFPLMAVTLLIPFVIYPASYALPLVLVASAAAWFPLLALAPLLIVAPTPLLLGVLFLSPLILGFVIVFALQGKGSFSVRSFPLKQAALFTAVGIILTESALVSTNEGLFLSNMPEFCAWVGGTRAVPALVHALRDTDPKVHQPARSDLMMIGKPALPALLALVGDHDGRVRRDVAAILIRNDEEWRLTSSEKPAVSALVSALEDEEQQVKVAAERSLIRVGNTAVPALTSMLRRSDLGEATRTSVFMALKRASPSVVVPAILESAVQGQGDSIKYDLAQELARFGTPAVPALVDGLNRPDPWVRWWAREALVKIGNPTVPPLMTAFTNGEGEARKEAATALGELREPSAVPALIKALGEPEMRNAAVWALATIGDKRAAPALIALYRKSPDPVVVEALGKIHDPSVIPVLTEALRNQEVHHEAFLALANRHWVGGKSEVPRLIALLEDPNWVVGQQAAEALGKLGDGTVVPALEEADKKFHAQYEWRVGSPRCKICKALREVKSR